MNKDIILNKTEIINRCIKRIKEEYQGNPENLYNYTKQDSIILNLQRACEASIDLAMHIIAEEGLGIPQSSREAFAILEKNSIINEEISTNLKAMVGFRNIAVHDYQQININILQKIIEYHLEDFNLYVTILLKTL
ncbi:type VII toxin-antitoxin system HepT family RNase toxin [Alkaliphilus transvaalensis]|uniref:type VII toxin-antitoxin system HepT family RNase toxin n=1 Tax=Alkaliphilus transvaalensis TaxID=114628 RepID=UPI000479558D|nr:DUF86 domain-containing protein [Alkaliphilus transvaalensis]